MSLKSQRPDDIEIKNLLLSSATELTLADRRLYNYLLHHAIDHLKKKLSFTIRCTALEGVYGTGLPPEDRLKESLRRLMRTLIEFETADGKMILISLLDSAEYKAAAGRLDYTYSPYCRMLFPHPLILEKCLIQAHFQQKYSNLLYEILATAFYDNASNVVIETADLRSRLRISPGKLSNFGDFTRFALTPALYEINAYASFAVKFHTRRKGMKVTHVVFEMQEKRNIAAKRNAKSVIPSKRPRLFIDNPDLERAYAFLLNAETKERRKYFKLACRRAKKIKQYLDEEQFDRPDLWFKWVEKELLMALSA